MIEDAALKTLLNTARIDEPVQMIHEDSNNINLVVYAPDGSKEIVNYGKELVGRDHAFTDLSGLIAYLKSDHCAKDQGIVFVSDNLIYVDLSYKENIMDQCELSLNPSEEYKALEEITMEFVTQKLLWKLLITDLHGCFDGDLLRSINSVNLSKKQSTEATIEDTGIVNASAAQSISIKYPHKTNNADQTSDIIVDWQWEGRIQEAFDRTAVVNLRLELSVDENNGIQFIFHPRRLQEVLRNHRMALVKHLSDELKDTQFQVYEGMICTY